MSNSTVRLYDLLKSEYPGKVYLGQIDQSVDLRSSNGIILLQEINETPTQNKDVIKRDQVVYNIQVIGTIQKTVDAIASNIRDVVEPYNDEYIMLMVYDSMAKNYDEDAEIYQKVLQFTCWPEPDGLNKPTGYYEYYANFDFITGVITILNNNSQNFMPITWSYYADQVDYYFQFTAQHNIDPNEIEVFWLLPNLQGAIMQWNSTAKNNTLEFTLYPENLLQETKILIRKRKDIPGQFISGT